MNRHAVARDGTRSKVPFAGAPEEVDENKNGEDRVPARATGQRSAPAVSFATNRHAIQVEACVSARRNCGRRARTWDPRYDDVLAERLNLQLGGEMMGFVACDLSLTPGYATPAGSGLLVPPKGMRGRPPKGVSPARGAVKQTVTISRRREIWHTPHLGLWRGVRLGTDGTGRTLFRNLPMRMQTREASVDPSRRSPTVPDPAATPAVTDPAECGHRVRP